MLIYARQFFKIRLVFHTLYHRDEVGDPQIFLVFLTQVTHYLTAVKILKKSIDWKIFARTSLISHLFLRWKVYLLSYLSYKTTEINFIHGLLSFGL